VATSRILPLFMSAWQKESSQTFFFIRFMRVSYL
jgi:hypothetical protein